MRLPRVFYQGAVYHVCSRGNNRSFLFADEADRRTFLGMLRGLKSEFGVRIYAYVLMDDHFHLLLETPGANLDKVMQRLSQGYTRHFNQRHARSGHLFETRYKCRLVQKDLWLMALIRYIHLTPVKEALSGSAAAYAWSSHGEYAAPRPDSIADWGDILPRFSDNLDRACRLFGEFVATPVTEREWAVLDRKRNGVMGDPQFRAAARLQARTRQAPHASVHPEAAPPPAADPVLEGRP